MNNSKHNSTPNFNKWLEGPEDNLYHFGMSKKTFDFKGLFGDIKVILYFFEVYFLSLFVLAEAPVV